jgi:hypothetical protein
MGIVGLWMEQLLHEAVFLIPDSRLAKSTLVAQGPCSDSATDVAVVMSGKLVVLSEGLAGTTVCPRR